MAFWGLSRDVDWRCCSVRLTVQDRAETYGVDKAISFDPDLTLPFCITVARFSQLPQTPVHCLTTPMSPLLCMLRLVRFSFRGGRVASADRPNDVGDYEVHI